MHHTYSTTLNAVHFLIVLLVSLVHLVCPRLPLCTVPTQCLKYNTRWVQHLSLVCLILCSTYLYLVLHCRSPTSDVCCCMCMTEVGTTILFLHDISVYWLYYLAICVRILGNTIKMFVTVCTQLSYLCLYRSNSYILVYTCSVTTRYQ